MFWIFYYRSYSITILFYNCYFYLDYGLAHLTHDLDDLNSSLHIEAHIINELSWVELVYERVELTMSWTELSELAHFDTPDRSHI